MPNMLFIWIQTKNCSKILIHVRKLHRGYITLYQRYWENQPDHGNHTQKLPYTKTHQNCNNHSKNIRNIEKSTGYMLNFAILRVGTNLSILDPQQTLQIFIYHHHHPKNSPVTKIPNNPAWYETSATSSTTNHPKSDEHTHDSIPLP